MTENNFYRIIRAQKMIIENYKLFCFVCWNHTVQRSQNEVCNSKRKIEIIFFGQK